MNTQGSAHAQAESPQGDLPSSPPSSPAAPKALRRRIVRWMLAAIGITFAIILCSAAALLFFLRTSSGESWLTAKINASLSSMGSGLSVSVGSVTGPLPAHCSVRNIIVSDLDGVWFKADEVRMHLDFGRLMDAFSIAEIAVVNPEVWRAPRLNAVEPVQETEDDGPGSSIFRIIQDNKDIFKKWPSVLPALSCERFVISDLRLREALLGFPMTLSCLADARVSRDGVRANVVVRRHDAPCPPTELHLELNDELALKASIDANDFGIASAFSPEALSSTAWSFRLKGDGPVDNWKVTSSAAILQAQPAGDAQADVQSRRLASAELESNIRVLPDRIRSDLSATLASGPRAAMLWKAMGLTDGKADIKLHAAAELSDEVSVDCSAALDFAKLGWQDRDLALLVGPSPRFALHATLQKGSGSALQAAVDSLKLDSASMKADAGGTLNMAGADEDGMRKSSMDLSADLSFDQPTLRNAVLSGDGTLSARVSGSFPDLAANVQCSSKKLRLDRTTLDDTVLKLSLPHIDVPHLLKSLPLVMQRVQKALSTDGGGLSDGGDGVLADPLLAGTCKLSSRVNGQPVSLDMAWGARESRHGLDLDLRSLLFSAASAKVQGNISAALPYGGAAAMEKGSLAEYLGLPPMGIRGSLALDVDDWKPLSSLLGMAISGSPVHAQVHLDADSGQSLSVHAAVPALACPAASGVQLRDLAADIQGEDLWGYPSFKAETSLSSLKAEGIGMGPAAFSAACSTADGKKSPGANALSALDLNVDAKIDSLLAGASKLEKTSLHLSLPHANILRLAQAVPSVMQRVQQALSKDGGRPAAGDAVLAADLLEGTCRLHSLINGEEVSLDSAWGVREAMKGLDLALQSFLFSAASTSVKGDLSVELPYAAPQEKGSLAEYLGLPPMGLRGSLSMDIDDWRPLSMMLGRKITGSPVHAKVLLDADPRQSVSVQASVPALSCPGSAGVQIRDLEAKIMGDDLWGYPSMKADTSFARIKTGSIDMGPSALAVAGTTGEAQKAGESALSSLDLSVEATNESLLAGASKLEKTSLHFSLPHANVLRLADALPGAMRRVQNALSSGSGQASLPDDIPAAELMAGKIRLNSRINGQAVSLDTAWGVSEAPQGLKAILETLAFQSGKSRVNGNIAAELPYAAAPHAKGSVADMLGVPLPLLRGALDVHITDWHQLAPLIGAKISGAPLTAHLAFDADTAQSAVFKASLPQFSLDGDQAVSISDAAIDISGKDLWGSPSLNVSSSVARLHAAGINIDKSSVKVSGDRDHADFSVAAAGDVAVDILGKWKPGELALQKFSAQVLPAVAGLQGKTPLGLRVERPLTATYGADSFTLPEMRASVLPAGKLYFSGSYAPGAMKLRSELSDIDLARYKEYIAEIPEGRIGLTTQFSGKPESPAGRFNVSIKDLIPSKGLPSFTADITGVLDQLRSGRALDVKCLFAESTKKNYGISSADIHASIPFTAPGAGKMSLPDMDGNIAAHIALKGQLEHMAKLLPLSDQKLAGAVSADISASGRLAAPVIDAAVQLANGRFVDVAQGVQLSGITFGCSARQVDPVRQSGKILIDFGANDGRKGSIGMHGNADLATMVFDVNGKIDSLAPLRRQDINLLLSGSFGLKGPLTDPAVHADIVIDKGRIELANLPGGSITELEIYQPEQDKKKQEVSFGTIDAHVRIPNQLFIQGYGLDCEWKGDVYAKGALTRPSVTGSLEAVRGTLDIIGKNFKLAEGKISFDGGWPVSPLLNIDMEYQASNVTADIIIGGTASNPKLNLTSKPVLPRDEILAQVLFGQSSGSLSHVQALQLASAVATLAGFGGADVLGQTRKALGIDVLKLNSDNDGKDSDVSRTTLEMGTYIHDNVYVGMEQGVGKSNDTGAVVEIELLPGVGVQAKTFSTKSEFGIKWKKNY